MSFFSRLFGRETPEEKEKRRREEIEQVFPGLRRAQEQNRRLDDERYARMRREAEAKARGEPPVPPLEAADEKDAQKIKRLLLSVSFNRSRDQRAYNNATKQLWELGGKHRAAGAAQWSRLRDRVQEICAEHWIGLEQYYRLLGEAPVPRPAAAVPEVSVAPVPAATTAREIIFGRRAIAAKAAGEKPADDLLEISAPDLAALAGVPAHMARCFLVCHMRIPGHERPAAEVIQAWAAALGSDLQKVLGATQVRQTLMAVEETGVLVLHLAACRASPSRC